MAETEKSGLDHEKSFRAPEDAPIQRVSRDETPDTDEVYRLSLLYLSVLALGLGIVTGVGAVLFRDLIGLLHNLFFNVTVSITYDANLFTALSRWGVFIIAAPVVGRDHCNLSRQQFRT